MLCLGVTRNYGDHSPLTNAATLEWRRRSDLESVCVLMENKAIPALRPPPPPPPPPPPLPPPPPVYADRSLAGVLLR